MYFDARRAKLLKPGEHIVVDGCPGLRLVASTTGHAWIYRYQTTKADRMRQIKLGQWPAMPPVKAAERWLELKAVRDAGGDPAQDKRVARKPPKIYTVVDVVLDYAAGHLDVNREARGAKAVRARLLTCTASIADLPAAELTRRVAFDLISGLADRPVLAKSVRNEMGGAWDFALDAGKLTEDSPNWWRQIMAGKLRSKGAVRDGVHKGTDKRVLSEPELTQLLTRDLPLLAETVQDVLVLYLWTACRGAEIVQMHARQITTEPDGVWWTVPKARTKNAKRKNATDLRVPLLGRALEVVQRRLLTRPGYVFAANTKEGYSSQTGIQAQVNFRQPYCQLRPDVTRTRLSVTHWSPHDLRRTARTMLAAMGCPNEIGEAILGHVQPGVLGVYNHYAYDKERRHWLALLSDRLTALTCAPPC